MGLHTACLFAFGECVRYLNWSSYKGWAIVPVIERTKGTLASHQQATQVVPPPPCLGTTLRKNCPLVPRSNCRTTFFYHSIGFFMVLVDAGQLFRCAGQHFMCVATGPPIRGDPISQSQTHIPLKPLPPALDPCPEATSP